MTALLLPYHSDTTDRAGVTTSKAAWRVAKAVYCFVPANLQLITSSESSDCWHYFKTPVLRHILEWCGTATHTVPKVSCHSRRIIFAGESIQAESALSTFRWHFRSALNECHRLTRLLPFAHNLVRARQRCNRNEDIILSLGGLDNINIKKSIMALVLTSYYHSLRAAEYAYSSITKQQQQPATTSVLPC